MRTTATYKSWTFQPSTIKSAELSVNTSLSGRELDVDTARVDVSTGGAALGVWDQASPLTIFRGGSQYAITYPSAVTRVQSDVYSFALTS